MDFALSISPGGVETGFMSVMMAFSLFVAEFDQQDAPKARSLCDLEE
ncbi:hypothetical protein IL54_1778 [Sphingobium sp. ba1]|nr:hypothetical protein IL54_1778 [Sphingobium sp. ba1]